jgi:hypothetical protein
MNPESSGHAGFEQALKNRIPGENLIMLPSAEVAEIYLAALDPKLTEVVREAFPNSQGLYACIRHRNRIPEDKLFVFLESEIDSLR